MRRQKYFLDQSEVQFRQVKLPWEKRLLRLFLWFSGSVLITVIYGFIFENFFGSPKEKMLNQQIENLKFLYSLADRNLSNSMEEIKSLEMSDEIRYRPVLMMESIPESYRNPGFGGVDRFEDLDGYLNSSLMRSIHVRIEEMKNMVNVQDESFRSVAERSAEWKVEMDHLPAISPVAPPYRLGDGLRFRPIHPVLGVGKMHYGQDFEVPYGTKVYATGDGRVIESGYNTGGFGNYVVIDHGLGLVSIYAHLSKINVPKEINLKRGDLIGLSGASGSLSTGPHLHYQINKYGTPVSAVNFFNDDITQEEFYEMIQAFGSDSIFR